MLPALGILKFWYSVSGHRVYPTKLCDYCYHETVGPFESPPYNISLDLVLDGTATMMVIAFGRRAFHIQLQHARTHATTVPNNSAYKAALPAKHTSLSWRSSSSTNP